MRTFPEQIILSAIKPLSLKKYEILTNFISKVSKVGRSVIQLTPTHAGKNTHTESKGVVLRSWTCPPSSCEQGL